MVKFFRCESCGFQFVSGGKDRPNMKCGAVVNYVFAEDADVGNEGPFKSEGMKPLGCGGKIVEISQEEATSYE